MVKFDFHKYKYGKELLVDCFDLSEIVGRSISMKAVHATSFYELFFFKKGKGSVLIEGRRLEFRSPTVLPLPPAQPRRWEIETRLEGMMLIFEGAFIETFLKDELFLHRLYYFGNTDCAPVLPLDREVMNEFGMLLERVRQEIRVLAEDSQQLLRAYLYQVLIVLNRRYAAYYQLKGNLYKNTEVLRFRELLKLHIREKQRVKEYAEMLGINRNRLNQLCQDAFGKPATMMIRGELVLACKHELLATGRSIAEISYGFNFSAPSNFVRFFKSMTRLSPATYREKYAN